VKQVNVWTAPGRAWAAADQGLRGETGRLYLLTGVADNPGIRRHSGGVLIAVMKSAYLRDRNDAPAL
jgi:hypothetical protein